MKNSDFEYVCRVNLPIKKDGNKQFCGDYKPLNMQIRRDSFPMPLIDDFFYLRWEVAIGLVHWIYNLAFGKFECC
jgi:hypothetical protein